jgi:RNA polymerase sigma-70 factor (ECF subfamily)
MAASTHLPSLVEQEGIDRAAHALRETAAVCARPLAFEDVYRDELAFVWRSARRLGVREAALDDVVQEVFVIVHRRLAQFEGRSSLRTWLFGITLRVSRDHRRSAARRQAEVRPDVDLEALPATTQGPGESAERAEAVRLLHGLLDELEDDRREIFVMSELEQLPMTDISVTLGLNLNTAYSRLRSARHDFEAALARHRARDGRGTRLR